MKSYRLAIIIALVALGSFLTACGEQKQTAEKATPQKARVESLATTPADIKKEAGDLAKTTMAYTEEQKVLHQKKLQEKMEQYNRQLAELQANLAQTGEQAKADLAIEMENLNRKKEQLAEKFEELQATGGAAYEDLKEGIDKAFAEMDKAYDRAKEHFQKQ